MSAPAGRIVDGRFVLSAPAEEAPPSEPVPNLRGVANGRLSVTLQILQAHPGLTAAQIHERVPLPGDLNDTQCALSKLKRQLRAHSERAGVWLRWFPGPANDAVAPTPSAKAVKPADSLTALVHRFADGQGAPPGTATERLYWLLGRMEAP